MMSSENNSESCASFETEMPKTYEPSEIEGRLFNFWNDGGFFSRDAAGYADNLKSPFTIVIPPPNVTGQLHMGHALNDTIQDTLIRKARMQGHPTRWIVGTDHAGIATQNKVEQKLAKEGLTRFDVGREEFVNKCWEWRDEYGSTIIEQLKGMGCSCDYDNERFTMDDDYAQAVRQVFCDWFDKELIYKGNRIINWCPRCTTALADDEVEHADERGSLWHIRYPLARPVDGIEYLVVATTRPETMLGDTGVAIHPDDERYKALVGQSVILPLVGREIPIFADDYVDPSFGTGCVKVTPAHDPNDFDMGQRHNLEQINILTPDAHINELGGKYAGMDRYEAREAIVADLESQGLLERVEDLDHAVGHCYRCDTVIEPWLSDQWFVSMKKLAKPAIDAVRDGRVKFSPKRWENVYFQWMENIRDWCISRQLWWGHRIPVFYCDECFWMGACREDIDICPECGAHVRQDEDVLDTWFSSQLWPFATYGWPGEWSEPKDTYYPTQVLSTARDIIFLWVARMIMSSMDCLDGQVPFHDVIIHPTVLDKFGRRMSKSLGNGVDPLELIDKFGADGMRFGLLLQVTGSQDMKFDEEKLRSSRNFATKIWNASRFVLMNMQGYTPGEPIAKTDADRWILSRLADLITEIDNDRDGFDFGAIARMIHDFFWNEFCDWYVEFSKSQLNSDDAELRLSTQRNLVFVLDQALRLLHPMMPFITEEIWQKLPIKHETPSIMVAKWPDYKELSRFVDKDAERSIDFAMQIISVVRSTRARYKIANKNVLDVYVKTDDQGCATIERQSTLVKSMANVSKLEFATDIVKPKGSSATVTADLEIYVDLEGLVDFEAERQRLSKELSKLQADLSKLNKKLSNEGFLSKAAPEIVEKTRNDVAEIAGSISKIQSQLDELE